MTADQPTLTDDEVYTLARWTHPAALGSACATVERIVAARVESLAAENAALRGRLARVEALAAEWEVEIRGRRADADEWDEDSWPLTHTRFVGVTAGLDTALTALTAALAADADTDGGA